MSLRHVRACCRTCSSSGFSLLCFLFIGVRGSVSGVCRKCGAVVPVAPDGCVLAPFRAWLYPSFLNPPIALSSMSPTPVAPASVLPACRPSCFLDSVSTEIRSMKHFNVKSRLKDTDLLLP